MKRIDIGGALRHHMWESSTAFPLVEVTQLAPVRQAPSPTYAQVVSMPMQASTYLETAAHLYPERIKITDLPLDRLFTEAVVLKLPVSARGTSTAEGLQQSLKVLRGYWPRWVLHPTVRPKQPLRPYPAEPA